MRKEISISSKQLLRTRDMVGYDHERGKVGWAHWRARKKQATAQYRRRWLDTKAITASADGV